MTFDSNVGFRIINQFSTMNRFTYATLYFPIDIAELKIELTYHFGGKNLALAKITNDFINLNSHLIIEETKFDDLR